jgi:hypothetical protein
MNLIHDLVDAPVYWSHMRYHCALVLRHCKDKDFLTSKQHSTLNLCTRLNWLTTKQISLDEPNLYHLY